MSEKRRLSEKRGLTPFFRQFEKRVSVPAFRNVGKSTLYNRIAGRQGAKRKTGTDSIFGSLKIVSVPAKRKTGTDSILGSLKIVSVPAFRGLNNLTKFTNKSI